MEGGVDAREFWEHSISTGIIAAEIAHSLNDKDVDLAFTMGLVHDIGRIIFAQELGDRYAEVFSVAKQLGLPLEAVETRLLLMNHADGMDRLLHRWNFPKELIDPIVFHHLSAGNIRRMAPQRLPKIATLGLANRLSHAMIIGSSGNEVIYATEELCDALKISPETIKHIEEVAREQTDSIKFAMVAGGQAAGWESPLERWRKQFTGAFRPVFASAKPGLDAFRIACDQLRVRGDGPATVGVVHIRTMQERSRVTNEFTSAETLAGAKGLPILCLSPTGQIRLEDHALKGRECVTLQSPVTISRLVETINALSGGVEAKAAA
jgi:putative nucleotidyltransferase with HDIG domain